jgi:hypothetical protein
LNIIRLGVGLVISLVLGLIPGLELGLGPDVVVGLRLGPLKLGRLFDQVGGENSSNK